MKRVVIDSETGEILDELYGGDRVLKSNSINYLKGVSNFKDIDFVKTNKVFYKCFFELSFVELRAFLYISQYARFETNLVAYENGKIFDIKELAEALNISLRQTQRVLASLCDKEYICRVKSGKKFAYYINPFICKRGSKVKTELIKMFENSRFNLSK